MGLTQAGSEGLELVRMGERYDFTQSVLVVLLLIGLFLSGGGSVMAGVVTGTLLNAIWINATQRCEFEEGYYWQGIYRKEKGFQP